MATQPALPSHNVEVLPDPVLRWLPVTPSQKAVLDSEADILLLTGSAGSLKTSTMLVDGIQERDFPRMNTYFFRRTFPAMEDAMQQARELFPQTGARSVDSAGGYTRTWRWPSGAMFNFRQLMTTKDLDNNWGKSISTALFDESTHWEEEYIRVILSRNRSSDPSLKIRARLGTNPGNIGADWHMKMFLNGVCPHCEPEKAPVPGLLRWDGMWPGTRTKLEDTLTGERLSITYILGNIRDHTLLGNPYLARLRMQSPTLAKALEAGCWAQFEGQYFSNWNAELHVLRRQEVVDQWWWAHWTGSDYGYSGSAAASCLACRTEPTAKFPDGRVIILEEYPCDEEGARREPVRIFAQNTYEKLMKKDVGQPQARRIEANYLGPDSWNDRGDLHTLAGQMNEVLEPHGLEFEKADNDRAGGAQLIYSMLDSGELAICDSCPNIIAAVRSRTKDPKEPVKVEKRIGDALDDYFDALRYAVYSYHTKSRKPVDMRVKERLEAIFKTDPTRAMMEAEMIRQQEKNSSQGDVYGNTARRHMTEIERQHRR